MGLTWEAASLCYRWAMKTERTKTTSSSSIVRGVTAGLREAPGSFFAPSVQLAGQLGALIARLWRRFRAGH